MEGFRDLDVNWGIVEGIHQTQRGKIIAAIRMFSTNNLFLDFANLRDNLIAEERSAFTNIVQDKAGFPYLVSSQMIDFLEHEDSCFDRQQFYLDITNWLVFFSEMSCRVSAKENQYLLTIAPYPSLIEDNLPKIDFLPWLHRMYDQFITIVNNSTIPDQVPSRLKLHEEITCVYGARLDQLSIQSPGELKMNLMSPLIQRILQANGICQDTEKYNHAIEVAAQHARTLRERINTIPE